MINIWILLKVEAKENQINWYLIKAFVPDQQAFDPEKSGRKRIRQPSTVLKDYYLFNIEENLSEDLANYGQAMACNDSKQWQDVMVDELEYPSRKMMFRNKQFYQMEEKPFAINGF